MELIQCECCEGNVSSVATSCVHCGNPTPSKRRGAGHAKFAWAVVFLASIGSLLSIFWASALADNLSAIQQCAVISSAIGFTVVPYCYARAVQMY